MIMLAVIVKGNEQIHVEGILIIKRLLPCFIVYDV